MAAIKTMFFLLSKFVVQTKKKGSCFICQDFLAQNQRQYSILRTYSVSVAGANVREVIASVKALEPKFQMFWNFFNQSILHFFFFF